MNCPNCRAENPDGAKFCANCGNRLASACPNCGAEVTAGSKFCQNCGHNLSAVAKPVVHETTAPSTLDRLMPPELLAKLDAARAGGEMIGERRVVTMLFCDVKGSTAAAAQLDPEEWAGIINGAFEQMIRPIYHYEGTVARLMGDGLLAFFGAPIAHEDDPQRAILAGLEIIDGIGHYSESVLREWDIDLQVRVGVNTGLVVVGAVGSDLRMEYSALGDAINLAARMEQTAQPGTVQIAGATYKLVAPLFDVETTHGLEVKGKTEPVTAYRVLGYRARPGSLRGIIGLDSPLVGREQEFRQLTDALVTLQNGHGQVVAVLGEAGLGKSRLVAESRRATKESGAPLRWLEGKSLSFETTTPYAPIGRVLADIFDLEIELDSAARYAQLKERIDAVVPGEGEALAPFLAQPMGVTVPPGDDERVKYLAPPMLRGMTFGAVAGFLEALANRQPTVMVLDDVHWIDPTSLDLLLSLLSLVERAPLLLLLAFRPRRQDLSWQLHETAERDFSRDYTSIFLQPLTNLQSRELVRNLLAIEDLPESVRQLILDKSEGNPFFLEEVIRSLLDSGLVVRDGDHWRATTDIIKLAVPDTLLGVITARLDRLDDASRQVAQAAAVLGREFGYDTLAEITGQNAALEESLEVLQQRDLIREKERLPRRRFAFKHALTQDAAYGSLLLSRRRQLHQLAADSIARRDPERAADIARHFLEGRQLARALPFLVEAGEQAARGYGTREAIGFFGQALEQAEAGDLALIRRAYEGLGVAQGMGDPVQALVTYQKMLATAESRGDASMTVSALNKLAAVSAMSLGQFHEGELYLSRAEQLAEDQQVHEGVAEASIIRCQMCTAQADFSRVVYYMEKVIALSETTGNPFFKTIGLEHTASSLMFLTEFDAAFEKGQETITEARKIGDREHEAWALATTMAVCYAAKGDLEAALSSLDEGLHIAERIGLAGVLIYGHWFRAEILLWRGEYEGALAAGEASLRTALPLEGFADFMVVQPLGTVGTILLEIDGRVTDRVAELHRHALRLLETPGGAAGGGTTWADLGWCALAVGDLEVAAEVFEKGLHYPTMFMLLEKPRHLAGKASVKARQGNLGEARLFAEEACAYAEEHGMRYLYPLVRLTSGRVLTVDGDISGAIAQFTGAEETARELGMRSYLWQSQAALARSLAALGDGEAAVGKLAEAWATVEGIAAIFKDQQLRASFLVRVAPQLV